MDKDKKTQSMMTGERQTSADQKSPQKMTGQKDDQKAASSDKDKR